MTLENIIGENPQDKAAYALKWVLVNTHQEWARKLWILIDQLKSQDRQTYNAAEWVKVLS